MQTLGGHPGPRPVSPLAAVLILAAAVVLIGLFLVFAVVAIPVAIAIGLCFAGYRALRVFTRRKTNELLNRDDAGRQNVRVLRTPPTAEEVPQHP